MRSSKRYPDLNRKFFRHREHLEVMRKEGKRPAKKKTGKARAAKAW
jgi:hypothetical protein